MKKLFTLLFALLMIGAAAFAQGNFEDVVYLKDGTIMRGIIVETIPDVSIKIKDNTGNTYFYKMADIHRMTREEAKVVKKERGGDFGFGNKGFGASYEIGTAAYIEGFPALSAVLVHGYRFSNEIFVGVGTGVDFADGYINVPAYLDVRAYFLKTRATPFFSLGAGYNFVSENKNYHGFLVNPAAGVRFALNQKIAINLNLGYKLVGIPITYTTYNKLETFNAFTARVGFEF